MTNGNTEKNSKPDYSLTIPSAVIEKIGLVDAKQGEVHVFDNALLIVKGDLTAAELIATCESLREFSTDMAVKMALACGPCHHCKVCAADPEDECSPLSDLPEGLLQSFMDAEVCLLELEDLLDSEDEIDEE